MRKIQLKHDIYIPGWGNLHAGEEYKVLRYNQRFVYIPLGQCECRLARKADCEKVY